MPLDEPGGKMDREQFERWKRSWSYWSTPHPERRMEPYDDGEPRKGLVIRRENRFTVTEEMHVRDAQGMPLGELRTHHTKFPDGLERVEMDIVLEPGVKL